jgi:Z1 domain-containing protein
MNNSATFGNITPEMVIDLILLTFTGAQEPTPVQVEQKVDEFLSGPFSGLRPQRSVVVEEVLRRIRVRIGSASTLDEKNADHFEWLSDVNREQWRYWPRLQDYLRRVDRLPPSVLQELDKSTDQALQRLESPERTDRWDRRGLVVGNVQSGKTTHYTALSAKALDAGYEIVIILAGTHNSLRSQTHERVDRYLIGRDSAALIEALRSGDPSLTVGSIGVGEDDLRLGKPVIPFTILTCTTSSEDGDFRTQIANQVGFQVSRGSRLVMVVKKNATILKNLIRWLRTQNTLGTTDGQERRIAAPTLIIDDEADHASVNTSRDPDDDPTTINRLIRRLLISFDRVGFIGYTATPFANIFIGVDSENSEYGPDLFPRSFIVNLKPPSDYIGPSLVFGHPGDESAGIPEQLPLPMYIEVDDTNGWMPDRHNKSHIPGPLPASLKEAIRLFVLVCAARICRGDENVHNSMLVHATRFINVQSRIAGQIENEIVALRNIIGSGGPSDSQNVKQSFEEIWRRRLLEPHEVFRVSLGDRCPPLPDWDTVWDQINRAIQRIQVMRINGDSRDALTYSRNPQGVSVIAVGGDKLSRGLTLEGLSVSYFLRTSRMFDTLMQMGRWFGYRPRYADLCRVYTTDYLYEAFREIALAVDDLRAELDRMADTGKEPLDFGLRVRTPSDGLLITAANKIRRGEEVFVRFAGELVQALEIARTGQRAEDNRISVRQFLEVLGPTGAERDVRGQASSHFLWRNIEVDRVLDFLSGYEAFSTPSFFNRCDALRRFIQEQARKGELLNWAVAVISKKLPPPESNERGKSVNIGGQEFPLVKRKRKENTPRDRFGTQAVVGLVDEAIDLTSDEYKKAIDKSPADPTRPDGKPERPVREAIRDCRRLQSRGLLLIYLIEDPSEEDPVEFIPSVAVSFPTSDNAEPLAYTVNEVWRQQYGLIEEMDDNGDAN